MTPDEHYREAERLMMVLDDLHHGDPMRLEIIAEAQVHATLATLSPERPYS